MEKLFRSASSTFRHITCACRATHDESQATSYIMIFSNTCRLQISCQYLTFVRTLYVDRACDCVCRRAQLKHLEAFVQGRASRHDARSIQRVRDDCWMLQWSLRCTRLYYVACCVCKLFQTLAPSWKWHVTGACAMFSPKSYAAESCPSVAYPTVRQPPQRPLTHTEKSKIRYIVNKYEVNSYTSMKGIYSCVLKAFEANWFEIIWSVPRCSSNPGGCLVMLASCGP